MPGELFAHIEDEKGRVVYKMGGGSILTSDLIIVLDNNPLLWKLDNYKVSSKNSGQLMLCPVETSVGA